MYTADDAERAARDPGALREDEPPILRFVETTKENRPASEREGRYVAVPIVKVFVRARGDVKSEVPYTVEDWRVVEKVTQIEKEVPIHRLRLDQETGKYNKVEELELQVVDEVEYELEPTTPWLDQLRERLHHGRITQKYFDICMEAYRRWKQNQELPVQGTPLKEWNGASPAMIRNALEIGIRTVEDAAEMTEEAMTALGMGSAEMKRHAKNYITSSDTNLTAAEIAKSNERAEKAEQRASAMEEKMAELEARLSEKEAKRKPGRPKKEEAA